MTVTVSLFLSKANTVQFVENPHKIVILSEAKNLAFYAYPNGIVPKA